MSSSAMHTIMDEAIHRRLVMSSIWCYGCCFKNIALEMPLGIKVIERPLSLLLHRQDGVRICRREGATLS